MSRYSIIILLVLLAVLLGCSSPPVPQPAPIPAPEPSPPPIIVEETLESKIYKKLLINVPEIKQYDKRIIDAAVLQIRDDIYGNGLHTDENAWDYISKGIGLVLPGLKNADLSNYSDMDLRQILLPTQLRTIDITRVIEERAINYTVSGLEIGLINVGPDDSLGGKSPQEVLRERVRNDFNNKDSTDYIEAIYNSTGAVQGNWPTSTAAFLKIREGMLARGEDAPLFVIGWSAYIVGEQQSPQLSSLVGRSMEEPLAAYPSRAHYPGKSSDGRLYVHTEPWVSYKGRLISAWMVEEAFLRDYVKSTFPDFKGEMNKPNITLLGPDGKLYNPYTLEIIPK